MTNFERHTDLREHGNPGIQCNPEAAALAIVTRIMLDLFRALYDVDPLTPVFMTDDEATAGKFRSPVIEAVWGGKELDPTFDEAAYIQAWKTYWSAETP